MKFFLHINLFTSFRLFLLDKFPEEPLIGQRLGIFYDSRNIGTAILGDLATSSSSGPEAALGGRCPIHPCPLLGTHQASVLGSQPLSFSKDTYEVLGSLTWTLRMDVKDPLCVYEDFSRRSIANITHS